MLDLILHCGGRETERSDVIDSYSPEATRSWQPVPHGRLLELVEDSLESTGLRVVNQAHALAREGDRYFGLLEVQNGQQPKDYGLVVGLRNSHDQTFPAGLVVGNGVFVCDNLSFSGEVNLARTPVLFKEICHSWFSEPWASWATFGCSRMPGSRHIRAPYWRNVMPIIYW